MKEKINDYLQFYKKVLKLSLPIVLQNGISNFVNLLDNIMIGQVGTEQMSGVAIVNQLLFIFNLCIFGAVSGAGIFTAQFSGQKNTKGVRDTFRFKLIISAVLLIVSILIFVLLNEPLINIFLHDGENEVGDIAATLQYAKDYLFIMLLGLLPYSLECSYSGTLRETGHTFTPMLASVFAVLINLVLNYILIYGKFGAPALGVCGAAVATVISRYIQAAYVMIWTHINKKRNGFIVDAYKSFKIDGRLVKKILIMGIPLILNETLWAMGLAGQTGAYSVRGLSVIAAININSTISNVFYIVFIALGDAVAILVGQLLGAGRKDEAKQTAYRIIVFAVVICVIFGIIMFFTAPLFPAIYNTSEHVKELATSFIRIIAITFPIQGFLHCAYFTIRSGGKTIITFLFDSAFLWVISVPTAFILSNYTDLSIEKVFLFTNLTDLIKVIASILLLRSGIWMNNIVDTKTAKISD